MMILIITFILLVYIINNVIYLELKNRKIPIISNVAKFCQINTINIYFTKFYNFI